MSINGQSSAVTTRLDSRVDVNSVKRNQWLTAEIYSCNSKLFLSFVPTNSFRPLIKSVRIELLKSAEQVLSVTKNMLDQYLLLWPADTWYGVTSHLTNSSTFQVRLFIPQTALLGSYTLRVSNGERERHTNAKTIYVDAEDPQ